MKKLLEIINNILSSRNIATLDSISFDQRLKDDLGFDSFMLAELTVQIEDEYGVDIFDNGFVRTISDVINKINEQ